MLNSEQIQTIHVSWQEASGKNQGDLGDAFEWAHANAGELLSHVEALEERLRKAVELLKEIEGNFYYDVAGEVAPTVLGRKVHEALAELSPSES